MVIALVEGNNQLNVQLVPTAVTLAGSTGPGLIWYEGLSGWEQFVSGREIPKDYKIHLAPMWMNESEIPITGHIDLSVTYPNGTKQTLSAVLNQDREATPRSGFFVQFEPFVSSQEGTYTMKVTLSAAGQVLDSVTYTLRAAAAAPVGVQISSITVNPTSLTTARHEYETSLGLGFWGDPFTIGITFSNPFDTDIWVKPDYALGHLTGEPLGYVNGTLKGFVAEKLLYFRLLLDSPAIQGDYSYTTSWQQMYDARGTNAGSNMAFVYDPDGVPRAGDERWLKIPAGGSRTTVKSAHLGSDLQVKAYKCVLCGEIITGSTTAHYESKHPGVKITCWSWGGLSGCYFTVGGGDAVKQVYVPAPGVVGIKDVCVVALRAIYFVYDPGCGQTRVGGKVVIVNWRLEELPPIADVVPEMVNITGA